MAVVIESEPRVVDLFTVDEAIEALLSSLDGYTLLDRIEEDGAPVLKPGQASGVITYALGESRNDRASSRQRRFSVSETVLLVGLFCRINPHSQRSSRRSALEAEAVLRGMLTDRTWNGGQGIAVVYDATPLRQIQQEVYRIELRFIVRHTIALGGAS